MIKNTVKKKRFYYRIIKIEINSIVLLKSCTIQKYKPNVEPVASASDWDGRQYKFLYISRLQLDNKIL